MTKSKLAFRTISEVAKVLSTPQHVLRFWETKFSQIKPIKRGGGRRYYRPEDVEWLKRIKILLYEDGYTIKGAQKILRVSLSKNSEPPEELTVNDLSGKTFSSEEGSLSTDDKLKKELKNIITDLKLLRRELLSNN